MERVLLAGSERTLPAGVTPLGPADSGERVRVTVVVRPRTPVSAACAAATRAAPAERTYLSREAFADAHGAAEADLLAVERFALEADLLVLQADRARRSVVLEGTVAALSAAFGTALQRYSNGTTEFRGRTGALSIPRALGGIVTGVFGLDARPQARAHFRWAVRPALAAGTSYTPVQIARAYDFPTTGDGAGQTIALIELGGGYTTADLQTYFTGLGIALPAVGSVSVDGAANAPTGDPRSADGEVMLDIEVAGAIAPRAKIVVYFAPNTDAGFLDAITTAIHDTANAPTILSISWGGPEPSWTAQALQNFDAAFADAATLGITICCAAGDNGSSDGVADGAPHVDFPASSPHVLACGGTSVQIAAAAIAAESVWNDGPSGGATGGGISAVFALPAWQQNAGVPPSAGDGRIGRGVPDVSGDADPATGYVTRVDGSDGVVGGTSAVAPLWAALIALINAGAGMPAGFVNPALYAHAGALRDITSGSNGAYRAGPGWDACTGLGSPDGAKVAAIFGGT